MTRIGFFMKKDDAWREAAMTKKTPRWRVDKTLWRGDKNATSLALFILSLNFKCRIVVILTEESVEIIDYFRCIEKYFSLLKIFNFAKFITENYYSNPLFNRVIIVHLSFITYRVYEKKSVFKTKCVLNLNFRQGVKQHVPDRVHDSMYPTGCTTACTRQGARQHVPDRVHDSMYPTGCRINDLKVILWFMKL